MELKDNTEGAALKLRDGEQLGIHRWVCADCTARIPHEIEVKTVGPRPETCAVCGVRFARGFGNLIGPADVEEAHQLCAADPNRWPRMLLDNVLLLPDWLRDRRVERKTAGGIILPGTDKPGDMEPVLATVIVAGPGTYDEPIKHDEGLPGAKQPRGSRKFVPCELRRGDRVLVDHAVSGNPYIRDGIEYRIVRAGGSTMPGNIVGVVEEESRVA